MVRCLSLKGKVADLFKAIEESDEYRSYMDICRVIEGNEDVKLLVKEIKKLQQESVQLEYKKDASYKDIDKVIDEKVCELNSIPVYQEYIRRMDELNDMLAASSFQLEKYINDKI